MVQLHVLGMAPQRTESVQCRGMKRPVRHKSEHMFATGRMSLCVLKGGCTPAEVVRFSGMRVWSCASTTIQTGSKY